MNKEECTPLDTSLSSQTRIDNLDNEMNQKSIGNAMKRRSHSKEEPQCRCSDEAEAPWHRHSDKEYTDTGGHRRRPSDHTTYSGEPGDYEGHYLSYIRPNQTIEMEALEPPIGTLPSPLCCLNSILRLTHISH